MGYKRFTTKPIALDIYIKGKCFICKLETKDKEAYVHFECARAYYEHKEKMLKELNNEVNNKII
jgi:hypothetical protein